MSAGYPDDPLWRAIDGLAFDDSGHDFTFTRRLARENGWQEWYAQRVVDEYKRFLYLLGRAGHPVTPSVPVDRAWHLHLAYSRSYWEELAPHYEKPPHHGPTVGGAAEGEKFREWYDRTLASYARIFGEPAPDHIWQPPGERFRPDQMWRWVDVSRQVPVPKAAHERRRLLLILSIGLNAVLLAAAVVALMSR